MFNRSSCAFQSSAIACAVYPLGGIELNPWPRRSTRRTRSTLARLGAIFQYRNATLAAESVHEHHIGAGRNGPFRFQQQVVQTHAGKFRDRHAFIPCSPAFAADG